MLQSFVQKPRVEVNVLRLLIPRPMDSYFGTASRITSCDTILYPDSKRLLRSLRRLHERSKPENSGLCHLEVLNVDKVHHHTGSLGRKSSPCNQDVRDWVWSRTGEGACVTIMRLDCRSRLEVRGLVSNYSTLPLRDRDINLSGI